MSLRSFSVMSLASAVFAASSGLSYAESTNSNVGCSPMEEVSLEWPHHTVCVLTMVPTNLPGSDPDCDGQPENFAGSGVLINNCTVLSCAHNFFNRRSMKVRCTSPGSDFDFLMNNASDCTVTPAAIRLGSSGNGVMVGPFGQFVAAQVGVDERYTRPGNLRNMRRDIGFVRLREGVWNLRTFMALQTNGLSSNASDLHVAGYSPFFDIGSDVFSNQHRGIASSPWGDTSFHNYGIDTHGGISGGPQFDSRTNRIVGIHAYDMGPFCAGGPRFGGANKNIAKAIFNQDCWSGPTDDDQFESMPWDLVRELTQGDMEILVSMEELRLIDAIPDWQFEPTRHVMQVIENTVYEWNEWDIDHESGTPVQMVEMILPQPEWLNALHAQALLSASRNWGVKYSQLPPEEVWEYYSAQSRTVFEEEELQEFPEQDDSDPNAPAEFLVLSDAPITGDLDGDGQVNGSDLAALLGQWGLQGGSADLNQDGIINGADLAIFLANWTG